MGWANKKDKQKYQREWCRNNRVKVNGYVTRYKHSRTILIRKLKDKPCTDCGICYPYYVMQFDHNENKVIELCRMINYSEKSIMIEAEKCDIVCANCHAIRTHKRLSPVSTIDSADSF